MTTRDYAEAYEDDSDNTRAWTAQDAQEPWPVVGRRPSVLNQLAAMADDVAYLRFELDEATAQRDEAWAVIARMTLDIEP